MLFEKMKREIIDHAEEAFPNECLGVIDADGNYVRLENVSPKPETSFEMREEDELKYIFPEEGEPRAKALVHSHPDGPLHPSEADMKAQIAAGIPFVMVAHDEVIGWDYWEFGDHLLDVKLTERPWRHGVFDCYGDIRAWYWQKLGIYLADFPRRDKWWEPDEKGDVDDLYEQNFRDWGFVQLTAEEEGDIQYGDVFLFKLHMGNMAVAANSLETHGGVYVGDGRIYHHLPGRLSSEEAADGWARKASRWIRYAGERSA